MTASPEHLPTIQVLGPGVVLLTGPALLDAERLIRAGIRFGQRDGYQPPEQVLTLARALDRAISLMPTEPLTVSIQAAAREPIGTEDAAAMLGLTRRQVQRLAADLDGRRGPGAAWTFDARAVQAEAIRRRSCPRGDIAIPSVRR